MSDVQEQVASVWGNAESDRLAVQPGVCPAHNSGAPAPKESSPAVKPDLGGLPAGRIVFRIPGMPQPGGSKRAFMPRGWTRPVITDANPKAVDWKRTVQIFAERAMQDHLPTDAALRVSMTFFMPRPQGHFGVRGLRPSAPRFPNRKPDVLKLARSTEDALTGIVWIDDARIVEERLHKVYAPDGKTGAVIEVEEIGRGTAISTDPAERSGPEPLQTDVFTAVPP